MNPHDHAIETAAKAGFDLNLIDCNLALAPEERLLRHDSALELAQALRKAGNYVVHNLHLLLRRLTDARFDFVVIGGYAGVLHGSALVTNDLDICAVLSPENIAKLRAVLADVHPVHRMTHKKPSFLEVPVAGTPVANLYLETDGGIIDVLSSVLGIGDYARLRQTAETISLFGRQCAVISLEDLITAKEAVGREKDLLAAKELRAIAAKRAQG